MKIERERKGAQFVTSLPTERGLAEVCVIILNWNGLADTVECLEALKKTTYSGCRVVVVDNGSEGGEADILSERYGGYAQVIRNEHNLGFAEGNNVGIRYALEHRDPDYLFLLNNDTVVHPQLLENLVEAAEKDPSIGIAGPKIYYHGDTVFQSAGARISMWTGRSALVGYGERDAGQHDTPTDVDWVVGCGLLIRTAVMREIGLLYSPYFALYEETEWCIRCRRAGYRVAYIPQAVLWHKGAQATNKVGGMRAYYSGRNLILFMARNASKLRLVTFLLTYSMMTLPEYVLRFALAERSLRVLVSYLRGVIRGSLLAVNRGVRRGKVAIRDRTAPDPVVTAP